MGLSISDIIEICYTGPISVDGFDLILDRVNPELIQHNYQYIDFTIDRIIYETNDFIEQILIDASISTDYISYEFESWIVPGKVLLLKLYYPKHDT